MENTFTSAALLCSWRQELRPELAHFVVNGVNGLVESNTPRRLECEKSQNTRGRQKTRMGQFEPDCLGNKIFVTCVTTALRRDRCGLYGVLLKRGPRRPLRFTLGQQTGKILWRRLLTALQNVKRHPNRLPRLNPRNRWQYSSFSLALRSGLYLTESCSGTNPVYSTQAGSTSDSQGTW